MPPVLWPGSPDIAKHSATTPWPAKAASPWINIGITLFLSLSLWKYCFALVWPSTTGLTASRCDGLSVKLTWTEFPSNSLLDEAPKWYLTSPAPSSEELPNSPANSLNILLYDFCKTLAKTFNLPLWDIPILTSITWDCPLILIICSRAGIKLSPPSNPNLFVPTYFVWRNFSKPSAWINLFKIASLPFFVKFKLSFDFSILSLNHFLSVGFEICMYS